MVKTDHSLDIVCDRSLLGDKYKTVIECAYDETYTEKVHWLNSNTSGEVTVLLNSANVMMVGFENEADALIFRIKFI